MQMTSSENQLILVVKELRDCLFLPMKVVIITADSHRQYFLPRVEIKNYNIEIDGRTFLWTAC